MPLEAMAGVPALAGCGLQRHPLLAQTADRDHTYLQAAPVHSMSCPDEQLDGSSWSQCH